MVIGQDAVLSLWHNKFINAFHVGTVFYLQDLSKDKKKCMKPTLGIEPRTHRLEKLYTN